MQNSTPLTKKISDEHYKWFTSVHKCWMGHRGVRATLDLLHWESMSSDVPKLILSPTCQKLNVRRIEYQTHPFTIATYRPHEQINVDTLVNQPDKLDNIVIIVVIDTFTRWIELYPINNHTEEVAALKLLEHFGRCGPQTDSQGSRGVIRE